MRHTYDCQLRWADQDLLGHINNVAYVDLLQEARADLLRRHEREARTAPDSTGLVVVRHDLTYRTPLHYSDRAVRIDCWVAQIRGASFTVAYEMYDELPEGRRTYLTGTTLLTPFVFDTGRPRRISPEERAALESMADDAELPSPRAWTGDGGREVRHYALRPRFSDTDAYGHVNNVKYVEYLQESRIAFIEPIWAELYGDDTRPPVVLAALEVDYRQQLEYRAEPYDVVSWIASVGRTSLVVEAEIRDPLAGDAVQARGRTVAVVFDPATGRPTEPPADYRAALQELATPAS